MADEENKSSVEIGFLEKCDSWKLKSRFFPSKIGGKPAWLDLEELPKNITCSLCLKPCVLLCQVYAPVDDNNLCFHRTIFIFICTNSECCVDGQNLNFKVFRCQLTRCNKFFSFDPPVEMAEWCPEVNAEKYVKICRVCGVFGPSHCGSCKQVNYCSKDHQVLDWKCGHKQECGGKVDYNSDNSNILFPEYEIVIEPEDTDNEVTEPSQSYEEFLASGGGTLQNVPDEVIEDHFKGMTPQDKCFKNYKKVVNLNPDQVIRYNRGGTPLKVTESEENIPKCEVCGSERQFEFQILSTLLNYLKVDNIGQSIDWGTLMIYTCKNNCNTGTSYKSEYLWKQDFEKNNI